MKQCNQEGNRAMILTTHSMEEADVLCDRIGIVNNGVLSCIGTQNTLKDLYGGGYHLFVNCEHSSTDSLSVRHSRMDRITKFIKKTLPYSILLREFNSQFVYQVPTKGFNAADLFKTIEGSKKDLEIQDWGISQCSLEDVFTKICELT